MPNRRHLRHSSLITTVFEVGSEKWILASRNGAKRFREDSHLDRYGLLAIYGDGLWSMYRACYLREINGNFITRAILENLSGLLKRRDSDQEHFLDDDHLLNLEEGSESLKKSEDEPEEISSKNKSNIWTTSSRKIACR